MNNCQKKKRTFVPRFFFNERDSRLIKQEVVREIGTRSKQSRDTEFDCREGPLDWFPDAVGNQFRPPPLPRFPRIQITKAELRAVCAVRSRHFGPLCGIKNVPRIFSPPPLFFFSLFLDTRKFADRETRERVVVAKNRGLEEKLNRRKGQIRLFDESFIYVVYIPVNQFNQNSLWQND